MHLPRKGGKDDEQVSADDIAEMHLTSRNDESKDKEISMEDKEISMKDMFAELEGI